MEDIKIKQLEETWQGLSRLNEQGFDDPDQARTPFNLHPKKMSTMQCSLGLDVSSPTQKLN